MSLPPFLFAPSAPSSSPSTFASSAATATVDSGAEGGINFRQAFAQLSQSKTAPEEEQTLSQEAVDPLFAQLNVLMTDGRLPEALQEGLRKRIEDLSASEGLTGGQAEEALAALRAFVDLLAGGNALPQNSMVEVTDLSEDLPEIDPSSVIAHYAALSQEFDSAGGNFASAGKSTDLLQGAKALDLSQWANTQGKAVSSPDLPVGISDGAGKMPDLLKGMTFKAEPAASSLTTILPADLDLTSAPGSAAAPLVPAGDKAGLLTPTDTAMRVQVSFGHARWAEAVTERAAWLMGQQIHSAELQLDPPELGPLQVRISVHQDQAVVSFVSNNPQVRDALDQSMMRLRELLQEHGMQLVDAGVSDHQSDSESNADGRDLVGPSLDGAGEEQESEPGSAAVLTDTRYGVDDFA